MKKNAIILIIVIFPCILSPTYGQWEKLVIDNDINLAVNVDVADIDGDTRLDLVVTNYPGPIWYKNNFPHWVRLTIDESGASIAFTGDMDGDDTLDVVACQYFEKKMVWYENNHLTWTEHIIDNVTNNTDFTLVADLNNNDTLDVVTAGDYVSGGDVVWYENNHPNWTTHIIESGSGSYPCIGVSDIDGDGLLDVVGTMNKANKVVWFRNENKGLSWTKYIIDSSFTGAFGLNVTTLCDINWDNTIDVVVGSRSEQKLVWYENHHPTWTKHFIDLNRGGLPCVTDVDGDDTLDIIVCGKNTNVVWYENNHPTWTPHVIDLKLDVYRLPTISDVDGDSINDLIIPAISSLAWYKNPYTTAAYATSVEVYPACVQKPVDTITIKAKLANPENHPVDVFATIHGDQSEFKDSLQLFDDGLHGDGNSADNIWGNTKVLSGLSEDIYMVDLVAHDLNQDTEVCYYRPVLLTTIGPVVLENYTFSGTDTIPEPGDIIKLELTLKNNSSTDTATNIKAKLISLDTLINVSTYIPGFGDIAAGENSTSSSTYTLYIDEEWPGNTVIPLAIEITSDDYIFWRDTLYIPDEPTNIEDIIEPVTRIYPNPADDILNIEIGNTGNQGLEIEILDITGKVICQREYENISAHLTEQIDLSGYAKGIYLVKIKQANTVYVGKLIVK